jgi:peptide/nickel transport system substrate-binding protein
MFRVTKGRVSTKSLSHTTVHVITMSQGNRCNRREMLRYAGLAGSIGLIAGCSSNRKAGTSTTNQQTGGTSESSKDTKFTYATTITPSSIDPMKGSDNLETILAHNIYDPLLYYTNETPPKLESWLAKEWSIAADNKTYIFKLRDDAKFHNGDSVTADDVKYSVQRMMDMQQGFAWMWSDILDPKNVTVEDDTTVKMKTSTVFAPFPFTLPFLFILNKNQVEKHTKSNGNFGKHGDYGTAWLEDNDAGSGPYSLTERNRKQRIVIEKNDDWWGSFEQGNVYETVNTEMVQESASISGMMQKGTADMTDQWLPLETYNKLGNTNGVKVSAKATFNPFYIYMHTQREPLSDKNVRKAISYAFDYKAALNDVMAGDSERLKGPLPDAMWSHTDDLPVYNKNIQKAKQHLQQSDFSGEDIELNYTYVTGLTAEKNMGLLLQSNLDKLDIKLNIQKAPWSKITSMVTNKESTPDMLAIYLSFSYADPDTFLYPAWHSDSHGSWTSAAWYTNDSVDKQLLDARQTTKKKDRIPIYEKAQKTIADDAPAIFVMNQATRNALANSVQGFEDNGITGYRQTYHWFTKG